MRGRWNSSKESVRAKADAKRARLEQEASATAKARERELSFQKCLTGKSLGMVGRTVAHLLEGTAKGDPQLHSILQKVSDVAPRLLEDGAMINGLREVSKLPLLRAPEDWVPRGKGRDTLFRSLCEHLLAQFAMPPFLWSAFFEQSPEAVALFVAHIASGGSVYEGIRQGFIPVPLTRKMCHDLMQTPVNVGFLAGLRRVQVRACGGSHRLFSAWLRTALGQRLQRPEEEAFWATVIEWLAKNPMLDPTQISPIVDFITFRRQQDRAFSMKGRSVVALLRSMEEWHQVLAHEKVTHGTRFRPSGYQGMTHKGVGSRDDEVWTITEILGSRDLAEEGRELRHCVYSYTWSIEKGDTSIWSMSMASRETGYMSKKMMTIEVRNNSHQVVQFRGKANRLSTAQEFGILTKWCELNKLEVRIGRW